MIRWGDKKSVHCDNMLNPNKADQFSKVWADGHNVNSIVTAGLFSFNSAKWSPNQAILGQSSQNILMEDSS